MITLEVVALSPMAREWIDRSARGRAGRRVRDRHGRAVEIGEWRPEDWDGLLAMYRALAPAQRARGLPPLGEGPLAVWVDELCRRGPGVVARAGGRVVGHAVVATDAGGGSRELVVFVHQEYQGAEIETALAEAVLSLARRRGGGRGWIAIARRAWRRLEAAVESLPWGALGPGPIAWIPSTPPARGDIALEAAGG